MKRIITLSIILLFVLVSYAQVELTLETTAGELKDAITEEQRQTVTDLTLKGSMDDSDFYLIRDEMPKLKILDMRQIAIDSIPVKAFYKLSLDKCTLPESLIYIGDSALNGDLTDDLPPRGYIKSVSLTGRFPKLGEEIFFTATYITPVEDNIYCKREDDLDGQIIYSIDGKIMYYNLDNNACVKEGTEIIESYAFDRTSMDFISIPSTLKFIKTHAFYKIEGAFIVGWGDSDQSPFFCYAEIPPTLEENAFASDLYDFELVVPKGKVEIYRQADPQWSKFASIVDESSISNPQHYISITQVEGGAIIKSEKELSNIQIYNFSGGCCYNIHTVETEIYIPKLQNSGIYILKTTFKNGSTNYLKIIF